MATELPELFPGYESRTVETAGGRIFCRIGGSGPPLLLLHGYPQSHVIWHGIAPRLSERFTLILPDLPGYGRSSIPPLSDTHDAYSKRSMARSFVDMMQALGHERFHLAGHDRGGRVAYRMALDHPGLLKRLAVLDILPTSDYWDRLDRPFGIKIYHWMFLAQKAPFPEKIISADPVFFLEHTLASWTAAKSLDCFSTEALQHNRDWFQDPDRVAATCEDYRAGATVDDDHDRHDRLSGRKIGTPLLALWGDRGIATSVEDPLKVWASWAETVSGGSLPCGHFLPEEAPGPTADALLNFFEA